MNKGTITKSLALASAIAAVFSLSACGTKKDAAPSATDASTITIGTTDRITSLDPAGSYDNGSYAVQNQVFLYLYAQDYNLVS